MKKLKKVTSLNQLNDRELMELIFANQISILREIDMFKFLYIKLNKPDRLEDYHRDHKEFLKDSIERSEKNIERINEHLAGNDGLEQKTYNPNPSLDDLGLF